MKNSKLFNAIQNAFKAECENERDFSPVRFCVETSNSYAWLKLKPTCLNDKKIMEKVNKNYPCEVPSNIDSFLSSEYDFKDYYCDCIEFKEEASNAKKHAMKKNTDKTMIKYLISNKRSKKCFVSIRENYSYITDSYAIFKAKTENIISVINDVCNCNITKEENDYTFYNKILHEGKNIDLVEVFERFKKSFNALYTMEEVQNNNFKTDKSSVNNNFVTLHHVYFNVLDENIISKAQKNGFDMDKVCVSLSEKHNKMIGFLKNNEVVLMCCSVGTIKEETQYISAYTEEEKKQAAEIAKNIFSVYSAIYDHIYNNEQKYNGLQKEEDTSILNKYFEYFKINSVLRDSYKSFCQLREDALTSDREIKAFMYAFLNYYYSFKCIPDRIETVIKDAETSVSIDEMQEMINTPRNAETVDNKHIESDKNGTIEKSSEKIKEYKESEENEMKTAKAIDSTWCNYDKTVAEAQLNNFGVIFLDDFGNPIDNEFELDDLYRKYKDKKKSVPSAPAAPLDTKNGEKFAPFAMKEEKNRLVDFEEIALSAHFCNENRNESLCILGRETSNKPVYLDLNKAIHVLIAGSTGSGKSCMMNSIISSLMMNNSKETASFLLIDPKRVEFFDYCGSDMLYGGEVIQNAKQAINALSALVEEMNKRFWILESQKKRSYMEFQNPSTMKQIFVCIDELSFLLLENKKEVEEYISKIGMLGRAAGIHLILATQHPDRKTITGTIQANIPTVIGLTTRKAVDSRMIIGDDSLTKLHGNGEAILVDGLNVIQFQGSYIKQETIQDIVYKELYSQGMKAKHSAMNVTRTSFCTSAIDNAERSKYIC